jgi:hypothetical protein
MKGLYIVLTMKLLLHIILSALIMLVGLYYLNHVVPIDRNSSTSFLIIGDVSGAKFAILLVSMYFGLLFEAVLKQLIKQDELDWKSLFNGKDILISLLVSPLVFILVYFVVRNQPDMVLASLLSFQNAFFWKSMLNTHRLGISKNEK